MKHLLWTFLSLLAVGGVVSSCCYDTSRQPVQGDAPRGFTALFNNRDLTGWWGVSTEDPRKWMALSPEAFQKKHAASLTDIHTHWSVQNGELVNDGQGLFLTTEKNYGDVELLVDYRTVPRADSGIYLKGCPQVQIWDYTEEAKFNLGANKGSGGLWNNSSNAPGKDPLVPTDKPFGEWNHFHVLQLGNRTTVELNGRLVVDHANMENYFDRKTPIPPTGPIQLQTHGGEIRWRNVFLREIPAGEANERLRRHDRQKFTPIFNGKDFTGWAGALEDCEIREGAIVWKSGQSGTIFTQAEYTNFVARLEFKVPPGGNNGLAIRYPGAGDTAYDGMCELQVLDENFEKITGEKIDPREVHGSAYGMVAAQRGYQRPTGEWNFEEVTVSGSKIKVELNGTVILDCDLSQTGSYLDGREHPGKNRVAGHFGFAGHNDPVAFRNISIRRLE